MIIIKDNFFKLPYDIKNHSTNKNRVYFSDNSGRWPGKRCFEVPKIYKDYVLNKTREYFDDKTITFGEIFFHKISYKEVSCGWCHYDENYRYASIIYLNEGYQKKVGTEIYNYYHQTDYLKKVETFRKKREQYLNLKNKNILNRFLFSVECKNFNKNFDNEKTEVSLKFNRYVAYEATRLHSAQNMFIKNYHDRMNLICFFK